MIPLDMGSVSDLAPCVSGAGGLAWYELSDLGVECAAAESPSYTRLPEYAREIVPEGLWAAAQSGAGRTIRLLTDSPTLDLCWRSVGPTGAMDKWRGEPEALDVYVRDGATYRWVHTAQAAPGKSSHISRIVEAAPAGVHEYLLYLPLFATLTALRLGLTPSAMLVTAPPFPDEFREPLCFCGGGLTQGDGLNRPGNAFAAILGRALHRPSINAGFAGAWPFDETVAGILAAESAKVYVLECAGLPEGSDIVTGILRFVSRLRAHRSDTPIVLVESPPPLEGWFVAPAREAWESENRKLREAYETLRAGQDSHVHIVRVDAYSEVAPGEWDGAPPAFYIHGRIAAALREKLVRLGVGPPEAPLPS